MKHLAPANEVLSAIEEELASQPECFVFTVTSTRRDGGFLIVGLRRLARKSPPLDESFEGSQAWWPGPPENSEKGAAEVLVVNLDADEIALASVTGKGPGSGSKIFLYPPRFLECLKVAWRDSSWVERINQQVRSALSATSPTGQSIRMARFPWLRSAQSTSGQLPAWPASFLWGPPGTGKTTTIGTLLASLLLDRPGYRVLLLSTTNSAIDQALVAVDTALEKSYASHSVTIRNTCKRIGTQFLASYYEGRKHLLPQRNKELIRQLLQHNRNRPNQGSLVQMAAWKEADDELRQRLREENKSILQASRLAVMTTTRAAFDLEMLRELPTYDLIVVDEASQVSLAHGLSIMPLARSLLFAGDPMQLSPICQSATKMARKWIGRSPFAIRDKLKTKLATCFLDEQSRMLPQISELVSVQFYDRKLRVCPTRIEDRKWFAERRVDYGKASEQVMCVPILEEGTYQPAWDGFVREESAERIAQIVSDLLRLGLTSDDIQVLTPYRAQRRCIRRTLKERNNLVPVTTVHRAQGTERKVIIFDPVQGGGKFLNCEEGHRLINVAFSRAQGKLIVLMSQGDSENPKLAPLYHGPAGTPLFCQLAQRLSTPKEFHGLRFGYQGISYRCTGSRDGLVYVHDAAEVLKKLSLEVMNRRCGSAKACPLGCKPDEVPTSRCI